MPDLDPALTLDHVVEVLVAAQAKARELFGEAIEEFWKGLPDPITGAVELAKLLILPSWLPGGPPPSKFDDGLEDFWIKKAFAVEIAVNKLYDRLRQIPLLVLSDIALEALPLPAKLRQRVISLDDAIRSVISMILLFGADELAGNPPEAVAAQALKIESRRSFWEKIRKGNYFGAFVFSFPSFQKIFLRLAGLFLRIYDALWWYVFLFWLLKFSIKITKAAYDDPSGVKLFPKKLRQDRERKWEKATIYRRKGGVKP